MKTKKRREKEKMIGVEKRLEVLREIVTVLVIGVTQVVTIAVTVHLQKIKTKMEEIAGRTPAQEYRKSSQPYGHVLKTIERPEGQENLKNAKTVHFILIAVLYCRYTHPSLISLKTEINVYNDNTKQDKIN